MRHARSSKKEGQGWTKVQDLRKKGSTLHDVSDQTATEIVNSIFRLSPIIFYGLSRGVRLRTHVPS